MLNQSLLLEKITIHPSLHPTPEQKRAFTSWADVIGRISVLPVKRRGSTTVLVVPYQYDNEMGCCTDELDYESAWWCFSNGGGRTPPRWKLDEESLVDPAFLVQ